MIQTRVGLTILFFVAISFFCCQSDKRTPEKLNQPLTAIEDFSKYKDQFDIEEIRKIDNEHSKNSLLFFYKSSCGFKYTNDSIKEALSYNIAFTDKSNTQIDVVIFKSKDYARIIARQLAPFVETVRNLKGRKQNDDFCLPYYLSRVYNFAIQQDKIYLFGYDRKNASSSNITNDNLRYLDRVCATLKQ